jgi:hypothetical protein
MSASTDRALGNIAKDNRQLDALAKVDVLGKGAPAKWTPPKSSKR